MATEGGRIEFMFLAPLTRPLDQLLGAKRDSGHCFSCKRREENDDYNSHFYLVSGSDHSVVKSFKNHAIKHGLCQPIQSKFR